MVKEVK